MRRLLLALFAITALASLSVGSAASMRVVSDDLTTGTFDGPVPIGTTNEAVANSSAVVVECDLGDVDIVELSTAKTNEASAAGDPAASMIDALMVKNIAPGCELAQVSVVVFDSDDVVTRSRGVLSGEASQLFPLDAPVGVGSIERVDVDLVG